MYIEVTQRTILPTNAFILAYNKETLQQNNTNSTKEYCRPAALHPRQVMKRERGDQTSAKLRQRETNFH